MNRDKAAPKPSVMGLAGASIEWYDFLLDGTAAALIAFLPSYQSAGVFAPLALMLLRLTQGLAVGRQWGGATFSAVISRVCLSRLQQTAAAEFKHDYAGCRRGQHFERFRQRQGWSP